MSDSDASAEKRLAEFEVFEGDDQRHYFRLVAANGEIIATSSEGYGDEAGAWRGVGAVKGAVAELIAGEPIPTLKLPEPAKLEASIGYIPPLPDPLPSQQQAALDLRNAQRAFNVADANLNHAGADNAVRHALAYAEAERKLNAAITVLEVVSTPGEAPEPA